MAPSGVTNVPIPPNKQKGNHQNLLDGYIVEGFAARGFASLGLNECSNEALH
jgi:hypothetical protein